jgi:hypothetical protein
MIQTPCQRSQADREVLGRFRRECTQRRSPIRDEQTPPLGAIAHGGRPRHRSRSPPLGPTVPAADDGVTLPTESGGLQGARQGVTRMPSPRYAPCIRDMKTPPAGAVVCSGRPRHRDRSPHLEPAALMVDDGVTLPTGVRRIARCSAGFAANARFNVTPRRIRDAKNAASRGGRECIRSAPAPSVLRSLRAAGN